MKQSFEKAKDFLQKSCDLKDGNGCNLLALSYEYGFGVEKSRSMAKEYYQKACDLGFQNACSSYTRLSKLGR